MSISSQLLALADSDPIALRNALKDPIVVQALSTIGVHTNVLQLHAPSTGSADTSGFGKTLCRIQATRFPLVTCKRCLHEQGKIRNPSPRVSTVFGATRHAARQPHDEHRNRM